MQKDSWDIDYQATLNALQAARQSGAAHFVLLSAICVQKPLLEFQRAKLKFEAALQVSTSSGSTHVPSVQALPAGCSRHPCDLHAVQSWVQQTVPCPFFCTWRQDAATQLGPAVPDRWCSASTRAQVVGDLGCIPARRRQVTSATASSGRQPSSNPSPARCNFFMLSGSSGRHAAMPRCIRALSAGAYKDWVAHRHDNLCPLPTRSGPGFCSRIV